METQTFGPSGPNPVAEEQFRKGFELAKEGSIDEAILAVEAAIAISQEDGRYHDLLGTLFAKKGLYEMALAEWKRSIECDPEHAEVFRRIESAEKMRAQIASGGSRWGLIAIAALALCFVVSLAGATYLFRAGSADRAAVSALQDELTTAKEGMIDQAKYDALLKDKSNLDAQIKETSNTMMAMKQELDNLKANTVTPGALKEAQEVKNRVQSELAAARKTNEDLTTRLKTIGSASAVQNLTAQVSQKNQEIDTLNKNYKSLNDERKRVEDELNKTKADLTGAQGQVSTLQAQAAAMISATEGAKLKSDVQSLTEQLAKAKEGKPVVSGTDPKEVLFLVNGTLEAVRHAAAGKSTEARTALEKIQDKAPKEAAFAETFKSLSSTEPPKPESGKPTATPQTAPSPEETKATEPKLEPTPKPEPEATKAKPTPKPAKVEKTTKPTPKPTPKPKPTPVPESKVTPTPTPEPVETKAVAEGSSAVPRAVHSKRLEPAGVKTTGTKTEIKPEKKTEAKTEIKPKSEPKSETSRDDSRKKELYETKKRLTEQALGLYRQRKFDEAENLVNKAYQIDANDPAVNQLKSAIRKAKSK